MLFKYISYKIPNLIISNNKFPVINDRRLMGFLNKIICIILITKEVSLENNLCYSRYYSSHLNTLKNSCDLINSEKVLEFVIFL